MKDVPIVGFESPAFDPEKVQVRRLNGRECISQLFELEIHIACSDPSGLDVTALLASPAAITVKRKSSLDGAVHEQRRIFGIVRKVIDRLVVGARHTEYTIKFVPRAWAATQTTITDIFQEQTIQQIVEKKLQDSSQLMPGTDVEFRLMGTYSPKEFVVQYQETDLDFICRLCEDAGIFFFFEHKDGKDVIVFADDNSYFPPTEPASVPMMMRGDETNVYDLDVEHSLVTTVFQQRDYNYRNPGMDVMGKANTSWAGGGLRDEFGAHVKDPTEANHIALVRAQEEGCRAMVYVGTGETPGLCSGGVVKIEGHPRGDLELLIFEVEHWAVQPVFGMGQTGEETYTAKFRAIEKDIPYRPPRITPKPVVPGVVTGVIDTEASSDFGAIDDQGRYRVNFNYDAITARDKGKASRPLRMAQPSAGADRSFHLPLKEGTEVIITCVNGDPDRPIIAGAVPNPRTRSPVTSANAEKSGMKTNKSEWFIDDAQPRFKLCVDGETNVFQVGAPNAPEQGFAMATFDNISSTANGGITNVCSAATGFADWKLSQVAADIVAVAGEPNAFSAWQKVDTVLKALDAFAKTTSSVAGAIAKASEQKAEEVKKAKEQEKEKQEKKKQKAQEEVLKQKAAEWDQTHPQVQPTQQNPNPPQPGPNPYKYPEGAKQHTEADGSTRLETEDEWRERTLNESQSSLTPAQKQQLNDASQAVSDAAADVKKAEDNLKAVQKGSAKNAADVATVAGAVSAALGTVSAVGTLISKLAKLWGTAKQAEELGKGVAILTDVNTDCAATPERLDASPGSFCAPFNWQGAKHTAALIGDKQTLLASRSGDVSVTSNQTTTIIATGNAHLKTKAKLELAAADDIMLSTKKAVNGWAKEQLCLVAHDSKKSQKAQGDFNMMLYAEKGLKLESETKDIDGKAKENIKLEATSMNVEVDAKAKALLAHGKEKVYLGAGGGNGYGLVAKQGTMSIGNLSSANDLAGASVKSDSCILFKPTKIQTTVKKCVVEVTDGKIDVKAGSSIVQIKKGGNVMAKGSKVLLG